MHIILETARTILRQYSLEDVPVLMTILGDSDVMHFSIRGPMDEEAIRIFIEKTIEDYKKEGIGKWAIIDKQTKQLIGTCGLHKGPIDGIDYIELGYRLAKTYWGRGIGTEVAQAVRDYAFTVLKLEEIVSCIDKENIASWRVAEKIGMTYWKDGAYLGHRCMVYRIRKSDMHIVYRKIGA
jgi:ribosomal-protein-alanine N-acetyltransferase